MPIAENPRVVQALVPSIASPLTPVLVVLIPASFPREKGCPEAPSHAVLSLGGK